MARYLYRRHRDGKPPQLAKNVTKKVTDIVCPLHVYLKRLRDSDEAARQVIEETIASKRNVGYWWKSVADVETGTGLPNPTGVNRN